MKTIRGKRGILIAASVIVRASMRPRILVKRFQCEEPPSHSPIRREIKSP
jgi:hypothetical protein